MFCTRTDDGAAENHREVHADLVAHAGLREALDERRAGLLVRRAH